jgi:predicted Zn-dependent protease
VTLRSAARAVTTATLIAATGGCALNPVSGRPQLTLISRSAEREIGAEESKKVAAAMGLVPDGPLVEYIRSVGRRVAANSPRKDVEYTFAVVDMEEPNAFALPGGWVYVSRGMLALTNSEDELAGVLGHEIGHVAARHAVARASRAAPIGILAGLGAAVTGIVSPALGDLVGGVGGLAGGLALASYSRDQEREADRVGQDLAAAGGWDPAALASSLRALEREETLSAEKPRRTSFFDTHPAIPERVAATAARAETVPREPAARIAADRDAYLARLDGLVVGKSAAEGTFEGDTFVHPDLGFAVRFPAGWKRENGRTAVVAGEPERRAMTVLMLADGKDALGALRNWEKESGLPPAPEPDELTIDGRRAFRRAAEARTSSGTLAVEVTFIPFGENVYGLAGLVPTPHTAAMLPVVRETAASFHALTAAERARIRETRLRLATARTGETPAALAARTGSAWNADMIAVANGLVTDAPLASGRRVKIALAEPYRPGAP